VNNRCSKNSVLFFAVVLMVSLCVFISGCAAPTVEKAAGICVGGSIDEIVQLFRLRRENVVPLRASGNMCIRWRDSGDREYRENLNIDLRFCPPSRIYFRGSTILGEAVRLGANSDEFWILMKPDQISTYQWGMRSQVKACPSEQWLNPRNLCEALGMVGVDSSWLLSGKGDLQTLTRMDDGGRIIQRVHIGCGDHLARRIEYYDDRGGSTLLLELDKYTRLGDAAPVPTRINITHYETDTLVDINLKNVKLFEPSPEQLAGLFTRPEPEGFEHVLRLNEDCKFVEQ